MTDASGLYQFYNAPLGTYPVRQLPPTGYTQDAPANNGGISITMVAGSSGVFIGKNFGDKSGSTPPPPTGGSISGMIFGDANSNGTKDGTESGIPGITLYNDANNNGKYDAGELTTMSDGSGNYSFTGLAAGAYKIRQMLPSAYSQTTPASNFGQSVTLSVNQVVTGKNFGDHVTSAGPPPTTGSLSGFTFNDSDKNGAFNGSDTKAAGKTVFLDTNNDGKLDNGEKSVVTDTNGNWSFTGLTAGTYHVRRVFPTGYTLSTTPIDVTLTAGMNDVGLLIGSKMV
jgi:hypothetical protein